MNRNNCHLPLAQAQGRPAQVLYVLRGPPGCGKSTVARLLLQRHLQVQGVRHTLGCLETLLGARTLLGAPGLTARNPRDGLGCY